MLVFAQTVTYSDDPYCFTPSSPGAVALNMYSEVIEKDHSTIITVLLLKE